MKSLMAAGFLLACLASTQAHGADGTIRAQNEASENAPATATQQQAVAAREADAKACANPAVSFIDRLLALVSSECDDVSTLSNIDTALQLGPR